jgi:glutathione transport system ATP-binding protein
MIFQEPMTSLNPVFTVGEQIAESMRTHQGKDRARRPRRGLRMLELVRIPEARNVLGRYPHQLGRHAPARDDRHGLACKPRC